MADWMEQQISNPDEVTEEDEEQTKNATEEPEDERTEFEKQIRTLLATNSVESLTVDVIEDNIDDCSDVEALEKAVEIEERGEALKICEQRLEELDAGVEIDSPEPEEVLEENSSADELADGGEDDEGEGESVTRTVTSNPFATESEGDEDVEEAEAEPEPEEPQEEEEDDGGVTVKSIAPGALTVTEAAEKDRRWTTLVWGEPGMGKSHLGMSAQSPVCVIDTEGKADELAHKFTDSQYDDPFIWQPSDFDEAKTALEEAISLLDAFREEEGVVGTIVVDSMSVMWGWSQQKYVEKFYPHADDVSEVELSTGFGSGKSDWKQIKNYHNVQFRQRMIDSPYHLVWTAMAEDDYDAQLNEGNRNAEKPAGEKENVYKVDEVLRLSEGSDGAPVGTLQKSGKVKHRYTGLRYPTWEKHTTLIEAIDKAEAGNGSIANVEAKFGVTIVEGNPAYAKDDDE